jgi:hypothetical protein
MTWSTNFTAMRTRAYVDHGTITDKNQLPVTKWLPGDLNNSGESAELEFEYIYCK